MFPESLVANIRAETAAMTDSELKRATETIRVKAGLRVLQAADSDIIEVLHRATFVSAYALDADHEWARADIEGALYIVKRSSEPKYRLIILNQRNPQNLVEDITEQWELSAQEHFIFFRILNDATQTARAEAEPGRVAGLWFSDEKERETVHRGIEAILAEQQQTQNEENELDDDEQLSSIDGPTPPCPPTNLLKSTNQTNSKSNVSAVTPPASNRSSAVVTTQHKLPPTGGRKAGAAILSLLGVFQSENSTQQAQSQPNDLEKLRDIESEGTQKVESLTQSTTSIPQRSNETESVKNQKQQQRPKNLRLQTSSAKISRHESNKQNPHRRCSPEVFFERQLNRMKASREAEEEETSIAPQVVDENLSKINLSQSTIECIYDAVISALNDPQLKQTFVNHILNTLQSSQNETS